MLARIAFTILFSQMLLAKKTAGIRLKIKEWKQVINLPESIVKHTANWWLWTKCPLEPSSIDEKQVVVIKMITTTETVDKPFYPIRREGRVCAGNPGRVSCTFQIRSF